ncbi:unnamed protein product [Adineta steineri]|uniref:SCP domain-containing protein n=1 Tax=Adineta steineri TaxID=433720 RepID=A0A815FI42_9BILA|nr:unnamed protein product [Adineta steineri]CAF1588631.1 unnamed protein product [Adineta steineri]
MAKIIITGDAIVILEICETDQACKMACEQDITCWGWSFSISLKKMLTIFKNYADRLATFGETPPNYSGIRTKNLYNQTLNYKLQCSVPVKQWYNEKNNYNWEYPDFSKSKPFAKLIWNTVTQLRIDRAFTRDTTTMFVVATYYPGGYTEESYTQNIKGEC